MPGPYSTMTDSELAEHLRLVWAAERAAAERVRELARELDRRTRAKIETLFGSS